MSILSLSFMSSSYGHYFGTLLYSRTLYIAGTLFHSGKVRICDMGDVHSLKWCLLTMVSSLLCFCGIFLLASGSVGPFAHCQLLKERQSFPLGVIKMLLLLVVQVSRDLHENREFSWLCFKHLQQFSPRCAFAGSSDHQYPSVLDFALIREQWKI